MFGNKRFDENDADNIIDGVRFANASGLYELIFKRIPEIFKRCPLHGKRYAQVQEYAVSDKHKYHS